MTDVNILAASGIAFILFIISLILSVRARGQAGVLTSMKQLFLWLSFVSSIILWFSMGTISISSKVMLLFVHIILFWSLSFSYILGLFGLPLTSLRIQLLLTLARFGSSGATTQVLLKNYSKKTIIRYRLHRLETSGEIVKKGNGYVLRSRWSYFVLHNLFLLYLLKIYRPLERTKMI